MCNGEAVSWCFLLSSCHLQPQTICITCHPFVSGDEMIMKCCIWWERTECGDFFTHVYIHDSVVFLVIGSGVAPVYKKETCTVDSHVMCEIKVTTQEWMGINWQNNACNQPLCGVRALSGCLMWGGSLFVVHATNVDFIWMWFKVLPFSHLPLQQ